MTNATLRSSRRASQIHQRHTKEIDKHIQYPVPFYRPQLCSQSKSKPSPGHVMSCHAVTTLQSSSHLQNAASRFSQPLIFLLSPKLISVLLPISNICNRAEPLFCPVLPTNSKSGSKCNKQDGSTVVMLVPGALKCNDSRAKSKDQ